VAAAPRIVTRDDQHSQQLFDSFPGKRRLNFLRLTAKKAVPIFRRILRRQKSEPRSGALKVVFVYSAGRMAARNAYAE
jgi:hypothetical protein